MFASLAPIEVRDRGLGVRRALSGATSWAGSPGSLALVLLTIGATTFDGASEAVLSGPIDSLASGFEDAGLGALWAARASHTVYLLVAIGFVASLFWAGIAGMHTVRGGDVITRLRLARLLAHAFIPIALAYLVAHYFSYFVYAEQAQFTFLLSDPLGDGSDLFGTSKEGISYGLGANLIWYVQVASLVVGHVLGLVLGHDRALAVYDDPKVAARSQYWMLAMMVGFTSLGLYLLSQANE